MNAPLEARSVVKAFGGVRALDGVDLEVCPGRVLAVLGPNGAGKTTLFNVVSGLCRPDAGGVWLGAERLDGRPADAISRRGVKRTFQSPRVFRNLSVLHNLLLARVASDQSVVWRSLARAGAGGWEDVDSVGAAREALREVGLDDRTGALAGELSFGEQKLVELARAWFGRPRMLLLDEPSTGLNVARREVVAARVRGLAASGVGVALIEHNVRFALACADDLCVLKEGRVLAMVPAVETSEAELRRLLGLW